MLKDLLSVHGRVARIVIARHKGSTPRETGASMCVWKGGSVGTIGGGRLEFDAIQHAQEMLVQDSTATSVQRIPLGPNIGQCCGGSVVLVTEVWDAASFSEATNETPHVVIRRVEGNADAPAIPNNSGAFRKHGTVFSQGWLIERNKTPPTEVYIYGAGHVGIALAKTLSSVPEFEVALIDNRQEALSSAPDCETYKTENPISVMQKAPANAAHFIMTPRHDLDLELCHQVIQRPFGFAGLIGSKTKWARFRSRLASLGHETAQIDQITCPIGDPSLGKAPEAIAIGVAARLLSWAKDGGCR